MYKTCLITALTLISAAFHAVNASVVQAAAVHRYDARSANPAAHWAVARALQGSHLRKRDVYKNSTAFGASWEGATLLKIEAAVQPSNRTEIGGSIEVTCKYCYVQGTVHAELQYPNSTEVANIFENTVLALKREVKEVTRNVTDQLEAYYKKAFSDLGHLHVKEGFEALTSVPPLNVSFDMNVTALPQLSVKFALDGLEVYMEMETKISGDATYEINLVPPSAQVLGLKISELVSIGVIYSVDLILSAEAALDIRSGFHLKFKDGLKFEMALFNSTLDSLTHSGAAYENLPVSVVSAGIVLNAILRLGLHAGVELDTGLISTAGIRGDLDFEAGVDTGIYADIVSLSSNITYDRDDKECNIKIINEYQLAVGAVAGASMALLTHTYDAEAATRIPVFTKTFASECVLPKTTATASSQIGRRADLIEHSTEITRSFTAIQCQSKAAVYCPASLQSLVQTSDVATITTMLPSGVRPSWPTALGVYSTVTRTVPFGRGVASIVSMTGSPSAYTARPTDNSIGNDVKALADELGSNKKLVIGLSVGLGLPALLAAIAITTCFCMRRRRRSRVDSLLAPSMAEPVVLSSQSRVIDEKTSMIGFDGKPHGSIVEVQELRE